MCAERQARSREAGASAGRPRRSRLFLGVVGGVLLMYLLDPQSGRRRRALVRDKALHYARRTPAVMRRLARGTAGPLRGAGHGVAVLMPWHRQPALPDDDQFIKERVESALGHEPDLPLEVLNFDAVDGIVRVRGRVEDEDVARRIVEKVAQVQGVRAAVSMLHTPDGLPVGGVAGDREALAGPPRAVLYAGAVRRSLMQRWPVLTDEDILAAEGHIEPLVEAICTRTGLPEEEVRPALDAMVLAAV